MPTIENTFLKINCHQHGAELTSICNKQTQLEYLWQAGNEWPKHAPVLFPIVGQLHNNTFCYQDKNYKMERHGFAHTMKFEIAKATDLQILFCLSSNNETLNLFPFEFDFYVLYKLIDDTLLVTYTVYCKSDEMYFSVGAHPAFKIPLLQNQLYSDYYLEFEKALNAKRWKLQDGMISEPEVFFDNEKILRLSYNLFYDDALVFKNLESEKISIKNYTSKNGIHFNAKGFPYYGIWAAKNANFVCLEPWHGIADSITNTGNIEEKEGIIKLKKNEVFDCTYSITSF